MENTNNMVLANNLKNYLSLRGKTRQDLCNDLGIGYSTLSSWLQGANYPRIEKIEQLASYFDVDKSDLIEEQHTDIPKIEVGRYMRTARESLGLTQKEFAARAQVSVSKIQEWEHGRTLDKMRLPVIERVAKELGLSPMLLLGFTEGLPENVERAEAKEKHKCVWEKEFGFVTFSDEEFSQIVNYAKFILANRKTPVEVK